MGKKILITGGTGYIGSHTAVELIQQGYEVFIVDNFSNSHSSVLQGIKNITGIEPHFTKLDLTLKTDVDNYFELHHDLDAVIHFAALKAVGESVTKPLLYYKNNLLSLIHVLENMVEYQIPYLAFSSSCTVYGEPDKLPIKENAPIKPAISPYGNTKQIAEEIIQETAKASEIIKASLLRYFNPIGAHPSGLIGELPIGIPNNLVPYITQTAAGIRDVLRIYGDDYDTPDGTCIRDYIHVVDLAKAHIAALNRLLKSENESDCEIFNIGTGQGNSVLEVVQTFEKVNNIKLKYIIDERREGDVEKIWADPSKANKMLHWKAEFTLEDALRDAWNWEKRYRGIQ
ncbi:MAG: UDP-glucose 4-epimerase GalE [Bacteroidales bacterium]|nr:UDP-glucose 4-epimerase GalE [Bacteroidales bacterium]